MERYAIVTGGSNGIGAAVAHALSVDGWGIINFDIQPPNSPLPASEWFRVDLTELDVLKTLLGKVVETYDIVGVVNNAGYIKPAPVEAVQSDEHRLTYLLNTYVPIMCVQATLGRMKERRFGRIVNMSSRATLGKRERTTYAGSKAALDAMVRVWGAELAPFGITCNSVAPGPIATQLFLNANIGERYDRIVSSIPIGRMGTPEDVARAVTFFMSPDSGFITGQTLHVCGGITLVAGGN